MEKYGWGNYRKEGLAELFRIQNSPTLATSSTQREILEKYIKIYDEKKELGICAASLCPDSVTKQLTDSEVQKYVYGPIKRLRQNIETFYKSDEGKKSIFEIFFIAEKGDYKLGVRPKRLNEQAIEQNEFVTYDEHQYFITTQKPLLIRGLSVLAAFLSPFLIFLCALIVIFETTTHHSWIILFIGYIGLILGVLLLYIGIILNRLLTHRLVNVVKIYFLKMTGQECVALVSYSGKCSVKECPGNIVLSNDVKEGTGYLAKCSEYPDGHKYYFDLVTLTGKRIEVE